MTAQDLWTRATDHLKTVMHPDTFARWIGVIQPVEMKDGQLLLDVDNDFYQDWLEENYLTVIQQALQSVQPEKVGIQFRVNPRSAAPDTQPEPAEPVKARALRDRFARRSTTETPLNVKFTFDEFIVGPSNSFAHAASLAVAQAPARAYNPLFIYGGTGLGKTHLMQAIGHHVQKTTRATISYVSSESLMNEYIEALTKRTIAQFRKKYRGVDLLLIDDIHFLANKNQLQEEFFHTFNALYDAHKQIVMTSDRPAREIAGLEQRLVSRFEWGLVTELESPDLETRIAILRYKQAQARTTLPDEILNFLAENIHSNIRALEGALVRTISFTSLTGQPLTMEKLRYLLRDTLEKERHVDLTFDGIQRAVAEHYDVRLADMSSKHRQRAVALPRQVAMFLCRRLTSASLPDIANAFSKTHATVLHAYKSIESRMDVDVRLRGQVSSITQKLGKTLG